MRDAVVEAIEDSGLHPGQLTVLGVLSDRGGMSQKRLGEQSQIEKSSMVLFLDALDAEGLVRRERDPDDRRAHIVQLTREGAGRFGKLGPALLRAQQRFLEPLSVAEMAAFVEILTRLSGSAGPANDGPNQSA